MKRIAVSVLAIMISLCMFGCSEASNQNGSTESQESGSQSNVSLTKKENYNGVTLDIDPTWKVDLNSQFPSITPSFDSKITFNTFVNGETENFANMDEYVLSTPSDYSLDKEWVIDGGTTVSAYTTKVNSGSLYTVVIGNNSNSGTGFSIFFNRGDKGEESTLNDSVLAKLYATIEFDYTHAKDDSVGVDIEKFQNESSNDTETTAPSPSVSQQNALKKASSYLSHTAFSYTGLIEQLEYEKFSTEDATYAADNCGADWDIQAEKKAESYLSHTAFSYDGLVEQLEYEGFTHEQAVHGADSTGL